MIVSNTAMPSNGSFGFALIGQVAGDVTNSVQSAANSLQSMWELIVKGGPVMIPIGICSLVALAVVVERIISLRRRTIIPPHFLDGLADVLKDRVADREDALAYCRENGSPIATIVAAGVKKLGEPIERLEKHVEETGQREVLKLRKHLRLLSVVAAIAPLLGLLGTIFGMIEAFQTVAVSAGSLGKAELLAKGIYQAMVSTAAGLSLAIPVLIAYHWILGKIDALVVEMDSLTVAFVDKHTALSSQSGSDHAGATAEPLASRLRVTDGGSPEPRNGDEEPAHVLAASATGGSAS